MTLHSRERGRPGPGLASVAKREDSYGPKSGPNAGSRASSPGEQAAACDYRKTRELGCARARSRDYTYISDFEPDGEWAVVHQADVHVGAEAALLDGDAAAAEGLTEVVHQRSGLLRR